jgi:dipeptidyl aminopeptidase/acylaminoacyl peptidase
MLVRKRRLLTTTTPTGGDHGFGGDFFACFAFAARTFAHRASNAFFAISRRRSGESFDARAFPPSDGPRLIFPYSTKIFRMFSGSRAFFFAMAQGYETRTQGVNACTGRNYLLARGEGTYIHSPLCILDGSHVTRLTSSLGANTDPAFSPDGRAIAFTSNRDGELQINMMNTDGSHVVRLTNPPGISVSPTFSSDGRRIAFTHGYYGRGQVYIMNIDGSNIVPLTNPPGGSYFPKFSPHASGD